MLDPIPLARPSISDAERSAALRVLSGTQLTNGPERARFESTLASTCSKEHAVAVSSGTMALELAFWALDIGPGDEVLVTAFGFPAAANALAARGAIAIPVDTRPRDWLCDLSDLRNKLTAKTKAIVVIDTLGAVSNAAELRTIAKETGIPLISDAACSLGGFDADGVPGGAGGTLATLSFHPRKGITTGEGGAVLCNDKPLDAKLRALRNHGQGPEGFRFIGTNGRLDEIGSAIGSAQLARLEEMQREKSMLAAGYHERLADLQAAGKLSWQIVEERAKHAYQSFAVALDADLDREKVLLGLKSKGIGCGIATYSFPELPMHKSAYEAPHSAALHKQAIVLPLYVGMRSSQLDRVGAALTEVMQ